MICFGVCHNGGELICKRSLALNTILPTLSPKMSNDQIQDNTGCVALISHPKGHHICAAAVLKAPWRKWRKPKGKHEIKLDLCLY